jgi:hypothetical protein
MEPFQRLRECALVVTRIVGPYVLGTKIIISASKLFGIAFAPLLLQLVGRHRKGAGTVKMPTRVSENRPERCLSLRYVIRSSPVFNGGVQRLLKSLSLQFLLSNSSIGPFPILVLREVTNLRDDIIDPVVEWRG